MVVVLLVFGLARLLWLLPGLLHAEVHAPFQRLQLQSAPRLQLPFQRLQLQSSPRPLSALAAAVLSTPPFP